MPIYVHEGERFQLPHAYVCASPMSWRTAQNKPLGTRQRVLGEMSTSTVIIENIRSATSSHLRLVTLAFHNDISHCFTGDILIKRADFAGLEALQERVKPCSIGILLIISMVYIIRLRLSLGVANVFLQ